jgi:hypothetical protein
MRQPTFLTASIILIAVVMVVHAVLLNIHCTRSLRQGAFAAEERKRKQILPWLLIGGESWGASFLIVCWLPFITSQSDFISVGVIVSILLVLFSASLMLKAIVEERKLRENSGRQPGRARQS